MWHRIKYNLDLIGTTFQSLFFLLLSCFVKRDDKSIAFGSWAGERYLDNSKYLAEYIRDIDSSYHLFWIGKKSLRRIVEAQNKQIVFLEKDKLSTNLKLLKCKYFFSTQSHSTDISKCNVYHGAVKCYLHHGLPIKKIGLDTINNPDVGKGFYRTKIRPLLYRISGRLINYDYYATSSRYHERVNSTAYKHWGYSDSKSLRCGTPRNDMLVKFNPEKAKAFKQFYASKYGFSEKKKVILYLPTFRRIKNNTFSFFTISEKEQSTLNSLLDSHNALILEKSHFRGSLATTDNNEELLKRLDEYDNVQELLCFADILITDYSGAFLDFVLVNRPIIHFVYDYDEYKGADTGLYCNIGDFYAGNVASNIEDLMNSIADSLNCPSKYDERRKYIKQFFMEYEVGNSSESIFRKVIKKEENKNE